MKMQTGLCTLGILDQINKGIPGIQYIWHIWLPYTLGIPGQAHHI